MRVGEDQVKFKLDKTMKKLHLGVADCKLIESIILPNEELMSYKCAQDPLEECIIKSVVVEDIDRDMMNITEELVETVLNLANDAAGEQNKEGVKMKTKEKWRWVCAERATRR